MSIIRTDTIKAFHSVIRSAYDYYPFGMLMPDRYVSDTSEHCVTISRPTWAWKEVTVACWDVYSWRWPGYTPINKGTAVVSGDAVEINAPAAGDGVSFDFPVTANVQQELDIDVERVNLNNKASVQVMELEGADWVTLAEAPINVVSGGISIPFTPKSNTVRVIWNGPIVIWVRKHCISKLEWVEEDQLVTVCDEDKDKYRFGYNDKEKINEWAGIGNYYDYGYRGLDTRIARLGYSVDPLTKKFPSLTPYQYASDNPIRGKDLDGREIFFEAPIEIAPEISTVGDDDIILEPETAQTDPEAPIANPNSNPGSPTESAGSSTSDQDPLDDPLDKPQFKYKKIDKFFDEPKDEDLLNGGKRLPAERLKAKPAKRGNAPIGDDDKPVELHHRGQTDDSQLDEMTREEHRGGSNFKNNHPNTGEEPSKIDRSKYNRIRKSHWEKEWDSGRFDELPEFM